VVNKTNYKQFLPALQQMITKKDSIAAPYIAFRTRAIEPFNKSLADEMLMSLAKAFPRNPFVSGAIISNLENREKTFYKRLTAFVPDTNLTIIKQFKKTIDNIGSRKIKKDTALFRKQFPAGMNLFASTCQTCHGEDGNGIAALAPPLNNSEWVTGDRDKLIAIVLYGLTGPVKENKKLYKSPEINGEMPGLAHNKDITDETIAQVLSYIRKNWNNNASGISRDEVIKIRQYWNERQQPFTMEELMKW
jgi:mono/diheme cytochrome c family protein